MWILQRPYWVKEGKLSSIEERPKLSVSFFGFRSPKLSFSITTDQRAHSPLIAGDNYSLWGQETDKETDNFGRCSLGRVALNWMMKWDGRWEENHKCIYFMFKNVDGFLVIFCSMTFLVVVGRLFSQSWKGVAWLVVPEILFAFF